MEMAATCLAGKDDAKRGDVSVGIGMIVSGMLIV